MTVAVVRSDQIVYESKRNDKGIDVLQLLVGTINAVEIPWFAWTSSDRNDKKAPLHGNDNKDKFAKDIADLRDRWSKVLGEDHSKWVSYMVSEPIEGKDGVKIFCIFYNDKDTKVWTTMPTAKNRWRLESLRMPDSKERTVVNILYSLKHHFPEHKFYWEYVLSKINEKKLLSNKLACYIYYAANDCHIVDITLRLAAVATLLMIVKDFKAKLEELPTGLIEPLLELAKVLVPYTVTDFVETKQAEIMNLANQLPVMNKVEGEDNIDTDADDESHGLTEASQSEEENANVQSV